MVQNYMNLKFIQNSKSELTSVMIAADKECGTPGEYTFTLTGLDQFGGNYDISGDKESGKQAPA